MKLYVRFGKRALDLVLLGLATPIIAPLVALVAGGVGWTLGRPVLFRQARLGLGGREFEVVKFRTMTEARDGEGRLLPDVKRLTRFGTWLRATSLDELPELWNVVKGDMSLIGPRPLFAHYRERYSSEQRRRHAARPGLTGWAQVKGRNALGWEQRFVLDVWYVDHQSLTLDLAILAQTVIQVLRREGISQPGHATAEEFKGVERRS